VKAVLMDSGGALLDRWSDHDARAEAREVGAVVERVATAVATLSSDPQAAVGVAVPGFFDTRAGVVRSSPNFPAWEDVPLRRLLRERLGRETSVDNDANAAVVGEAWVGAAAGLSDVVMLTLGTGVGTGFLVNGGVVRGARGAAAEGGHVRLPDGRRLCGCGRRGCLEAYTSGPGIVATAAHVWGMEERPDPPATAEALFALHAEGDLQAADAVGRFAVHLAQGITTLVHVFAPEAVVLGGGVATSLEQFREFLEMGIRGLAIPACAADVLPIRAAELGTAAGAVGAARIALQSTGSGAK